MYDGLKKAPLVSVINPDGAFYMMVNVSATFGKSYEGEKINSALDFANLLIKHAKVATVPCEGFGAPDFLRLSYATSEADIKKGVDRMAEFLSKVK